MKLLVVSQYFWPESFRINDLVRTLVERGHDIDVLTGKPNYPEGNIFPGYRAWGCQQERWEGATVHRLPLVGRGSNSAILLALNYLTFILSGLVFAPRLLRKQRYDAIFVYGLSPILQAIPALLLGWIKKAPVAIWVQDLWPDSLSATGFVRSPIILKAVELVVRFIYSKADLLLVQSRAFEPLVAKMAPGKGIVYFPNSVDDIFCKPGAVPLPVTSALDGAFPVMFAGNVGAGQAVEVIVEAATMLQDYPDIQFAVFGVGSRWKWMCAEVESRGLTNVQLPGRFPIETMPGLMQKASVLLVTLADEPIFAATVPNKVQAYLAVGRPILACLNGEGARLVNEAQAGLSVPALDAKGLAAAVLRLYKMTDGELAKMGANGQRYFKENFDNDKLLDELVVHLSGMKIPEKGLA